MVRRPLRNALHAARLPGCQAEGAVLNKRLQTEAMARSDRRGFAVVADEVRKLAEKTGSWTGELNDIDREDPVAHWAGLRSMRTLSERSGKNVGLMDSATQSMRRSKTRSTRRRTRIGAGPSCSTKTSDAPRSRPAWRHGGAASLRIGRAPL